MRQDTPPHYTNSGLDLPSFMEDTRREPSFSKNIISPSVSRNSRPYVHNRRVKRAHLGGTIGA